MAATTCEVWFYHLERSTLDQVLPGLLEKTRERGWRALVRSSSAARLVEVDETLWTYRDDSFLAHGRDSAEHAARQPILLTEGLENPNGAQALFILDGADLPDAEKFERCFILFDGRDEAAVSAVLASLVTPALSAVWKFVAVAAAVAPIVNSPSAGGEFVVAVSVRSSLDPSGSVKVRRTFSPGSGFWPMLIVMVAGVPVGPVAVVPVMPEFAELSLKPNG